MTDRKQLEQAIAALEARRRRFGDATVDASLAALKANLATIFFMDICGHTETVCGLDPINQQALIDPILLVYG